jgi:hypothetical protein
VDDGIVMMLQAAARRLLPFFNSVLLAKWETDSYAYSHITDELKRLYHADENFQQLNNACERIVLRTLTLEQECNSDLSGEYTSAYILKHSSPVVQAQPQPVDRSTQTPGWMVSKPKRIQGYGGALYNVLKDAHTKGEARPSVHDVLALFAVNKPREVAKVLPGEGLDYYTADGATKHATIKTIRGRIAELTKPKPR